MDVEALVASFIRVADLAGVTLLRDAVVVEVLPAPHRPRALPPRKMGVYIFQWGNQYLKVGKAGPRSHARYTSQHYNAKSSNSNLAKSILKEGESLGIRGINQGNVGEWIKGNTDRINILLDDDAGMPVLNLLEAFLQCRLKPRFEGFDGQK
jgi:hypothetical protein